MSNSDTLSIEFIDPKTNNTLDIFTVYVQQQINYLTANDKTNSISNATSFHLEKDYFTPANGFTFVIEDDRSFQLSLSLQRGYKVKLTINNNVNGIFYIFDYHLSYSKNGGSSLSITCKDLLEYMAQGCVYPNMPTKYEEQAIFSDLNTRFPPETRLGDALFRIAKSFQYVTGEQIIIKTDDSDSMTIASGFGAGVRVKGKTAKGRQTSLQNNINHLTQCIKGESYLAYMLRLAKMAGFNIKMSSYQENVILVKPPTYDRSNSSPFKLFHFLQAPDNAKNNIEEAQLNFNFDRQPSIAIVEVTFAGSNTIFSKTTPKGFAINEMTGVLSPKETSNDPPPAIPMLRNALQQLSTGASSNLQGAPFNDELYQIRKQLNIDMKTDVSLPYYVSSSNAHSMEEAAFAASMIIAEAQDKYLEFTYRVSGWSQNGYVYQPDMLINVIDQTLNPLQTSPFTLWIRKCNYIKNRNGGTETILTCTLPYTHNFEVVDNEPNPYAS